MPAATKKKPALSPQRKAAIAWSALSKIADKKAKAARDLLEAGEVQSVELMVRAKLGRAMLVEHVTGTLHVCEDQLRADASKCDPAEVLAVLADELTPERRAKLFASMIDTYRATGSLESRVTKELLAECQGLIDQLRDSRTKTVRGNFRFVSDEDAAATPAAAS